MNKKWTGCCYSTEPADGGIQCEIGNIKQEHRDEVDNHTWKHLPEEQRKLRTMTMFDHRYLDVISFQLSKAPTDQQPTAENDYKLWIPVLLLNLFKWIQKALHMVNKTRQGRYAAGKISPFRLTAKTVQLLFVWGRFLIRHIILVHTPLTYFQALFLKSIIFSLFYLNKISLQAPKYHNMSGGRVT